MSGHGYVGCLVSWAPHERIACLLHREGSAFQKKTELLTLLKVKLSALLKLCIDGDYDVGKLLSLAQGRFYLLHQNEALIEGKKK